MNHIYYGIGLKSSYKQFLSLFLGLEKGPIHVHRSTAVCAVMSTFLIVVKLARLGELLANQNRKVYCRYFYVMSNKYHKSYPV